MKKTKETARGSLQIQIENNFTRTFFAIRSDQINEVFYDEFQSFRELRNTETQVVQPPDRCSEHFLRGTDYDKSSLPSQGGRLFQPAIL